MSEDGCQKPVRTLGRLSAGMGIASLACLVALPVIGLLACSVPDLPAWVPTVSITCIAGVFLCFPAILLGHVSSAFARSDASRGPVQPPPRGGLIAGYATLLLAAGGGIATIPARNAARTRSQADAIRCDFAQIRSALHQYAITHPLKRGDTVSFEQLVDGGQISKRDPMAQGKPGHGRRFPDSLNYRRTLRHLNPYRALHVPLAYRQVFASAIPVDDPMWGAFPPAELTPPTTNTFLLAIRDAPIPDVRRHLDRGADPDTADANGWTALMYAAFRGDHSTEAAALLLDRGADPDPADADGWTALLHAVARHHEPLALLLLDRGAGYQPADPDRRETALHKALAARPPMAGLAAQLVLAGADVDAADADGTTPLHLAAAAGLTDLAGALIERGASANATNAAGRSPLHSACGGPEIAAARFLVGHGARVDAPDAGGRSPLFIAAAAGNLTLVQLLHQSGASLQHRTREGRTVVMEVARIGRFPRLLDYLVECGADVNALDQSGESVLAHAVAGGSVDMIATLIAAGARPAPTARHSDAPLNRADRPEARPALGPGPP